MCIKMRIVNSREFDQTVTGLVCAFGCIAERKRTLIWIWVFDSSELEIIRSELEAVGSCYAGVVKID